MEIPTNDVFLEKLSLDDLKEAAMEQSRMLGNAYYLTSEEDPDSVIKVTEEMFKALSHNRGNDGQTKTNSLGKKFVEIDKKK